MLKIRDLKYGGERPLLDAVQRDSQERGSERDLLPGSSFTPDGRALITSFNGKIWRVTIPEGSATEIPFSAVIEQQLGPSTQSSIASTRARSRCARFGISGSLPTAVGWRSTHFVTSGRPIVREVPHAGPPPQTLASTRRPGRLMDSTLVYVTWDDTDGGHVYRVRSDGSGAPEQLTRQAGFYNKVTYTPDGKRLVFVRAPVAWRLAHSSEMSGRSRPAGVELVEMPASGGEVTRIAPLALVTEWILQFPLPISSRAATAFIFMTVPTGWCRCGRMAPIVQVLLRARFGGPVHEMLLSPDSRQVLIRAKFSQLFVVTLPHVPGPAPTLSLDNLAAAPDPCDPLGSIRRGLSNLVGRWRHRALWIRACVLQP